MQAFSAREATGQSAAELRISPMALDSDFRIVDSRRTGHGFEASIDAIQTNVERSFARNLPQTYIRRKSSLDQERKITNR